MASLSMFTSTKSQRAGSGRLSESARTALRLEVVLFDDAVLSAQSLAEQLIDGTYSICTCDSAAAALAEVVCSFPRCLIVDLTRSTLGGMGLLRLVRRYGFRVAVAVIADPMDLAVQAELSTLRPDATFHKPLESNQLNAWVRVISEESDRFW